MSSQKIYFDINVVEKYAINQIQFNKAKNGKMFMIYNYDPKKFQKGIRIQENIDIFGIDFSALYNVDFGMDGGVSLNINRLSIKNYTPVFKPILTALLNIMNVNKITISNSTGDIEMLKCNKKVSIKDCHNLSIDVICGCSVYYDGENKNVKVGDFIECDNKKALVPKKIAVSGSNYINDDKELNEFIKRTAYYN